MDDGQKKKKKSIDFGKVLSDGVTLTKEIHLTGTIEGKVNSVISRVGE